MASLAATALVLSGCVTPGIPVVVDRAETSAAKGATEPASGVATKPANGVYVVRQGDTLSGISRKTGVGVAALVGFNDIHNPNRIHPGMKLRLSASAPRRPSPAGSSRQSSPAKPQTARQTRQRKTQRQKTQPKPSAAPATAAARNVDGIAWRWPTASPVVGEYGGVNKGLDFDVQPGAEIVSAGAGDVVYAGAGLAGFERLVIVRHNAQYLSAYSVNQPLAVKEGQAIKGGQIIASVRGNGRTARTLHFEIRKNGEPISPRTVLR